MRADAGAVADAAKHVDGDICADLRAGIYDAVWTNNRAFTNHGGFGDQRCGVDVGQPAGIA